MLRFVPLQSSVEASFWRELATKKLDELKLSEEPIPITGYICPARHAQVASQLELDAKSFETQHSSSRQGYHAVPGVLYNLNSLERFKTFDRAEAVQQVASQVREDICSGIAESDPSLLCRFLLLAHADLKNYQYHYWFAFPALKPLQAFTAVAQPLGAAFEEPVVGKITTACDEWRGMGSFVSSETVKSSAPFWMLTPPNGAPGNVEAVPLASGASPGNLLWPDKKMVVAMSDPSHLPANSGWILRNLLMLVAKRWSCSSIRVVCIRDRHGRSDPSASIALDVNITTIPNDVDNCVQHAPGWEVNQTGKSAPRLANLRSYFDPVQMAEQAVDLNLRLMLWRAAPNLDTRKIANTKCLLLGMGTLGCAVSRTLVGWGVRNITCVDSGRVAFSNPARQSLYEFEDCLEGGKPKAECAVQHLKRIFPALEVKGVMLTIPMPGHPATSQEESQSLKEATEQLQDLVMSHDVVFLLTDTREARWLPSLLCAAFNRIAVDIALGFDSFLVMRHGSGLGAGGRPSGGRLGCYFCNDVVAPLNSTADRALDQQCTVARPGLAPIASSLGVELFAAMIQHPEGIDAPAFLSHSASEASSSSTGGPLGGVPHMIRGQLNGFSQVCMEGRAFSQCTACSQAVVEGYLAEGWEFVQRSLQDPKFLEDLTGLTALHQAAESMANFDIDDSDTDEVGKACDEDGDGWTTL